MYTPLKETLRTFIHSLTILCFNHWFLVGWKKCYSGKVESQKYWTPRKIQKGKSIIKWENQKLKHIKRMDTCNNCHIHDLVRAFCYLEKKVKSRKYWTPRKIQKGKSLIKWQNQMINTSNEWTTTVILKLIEPGFIAI